MALPEKPALEGLEAKWNTRWEASGVYRFDRTRPREDVYAIGAPLGLSGSVSKGIVSATGRPGAGGPEIQIDVPVNPGNSGGPLIDADGPILPFRRWAERFYVREPDPTPRTGA